MASKPEWKRRTVLKNSSLHRIKYDVPPPPATLPNHQCLPLAMTINIHRKVPYATNRSRMLLPRDIALDAGAPIVWYVLSKDVPVRLLLVLFLLMILPKQKIFLTTIFPPVLTIPAHNLFDRDAVVEAVAIIPGAMPAAHRMMMTLTRVLILLLPPHNQMMFLLPARGLLVERNNLPHHSPILLTIILMNWPQIPMMMPNFVLTLQTVTLKQTLLLI
jgi:hypothetical protein